MPARGPDERPSAQRPRPIARRSAAVAPALARLALAVALLAGADGSAGEVARHAAGPRAASPPSVTVAARPAAAAETTALQAPRSGAFVFKRAGKVDASAPALTVRFSVAGNALAGTDHVALASPAVIPQGEASVVVPVGVLDDEEPEGAETVVVQIEEDPAYVLSPQPAKQAAAVTIADDDLPEVTIQALDAEAADPSVSATDTGAFRIVRTGATGAPLKVAFTRGGTAASGKDYALRVGTAKVAGSSVTVPAGEACVDVVVAPTTGASLQPDEDVTLTLRPGRRYELAALGARDRAAAERAGAAAPSASVQIRRSLTAATPGIPQTSLPAWVADNQTHDFQLTAAGGTPPYAFTATGLPAGFALSPGGVLSGNAGLLPPGSTMRITPPFTVTVNDSAGGSREVQLRLTIIAPAPRISTTLLPSATEGRPYAAQLTAEGGTGTLHWFNSPFDGGFRPSWLNVGLDGLLSGTPPAGTAGRTFRFGVCVVDEVGKSHARQVSVTVVPGPPIIRVADAARAEGDSGSASLSFPVSLSRAADVAVTVQYLTVASTKAAAEATAGEDYEPVQGTLTIGPGDRQGSITVTVLGDAAHEPDEAFTLRLWGPSGGRFLGEVPVITARGTIRNDDPESTELQLTVTSATATFVPQSEYLGNRYHVVITGTATGRVGSQLRFNAGGGGSVWQLADGVIAGDWTYVPPDQDLPRLTRTGAEAATTNWSYTVDCISDPGVPADWRQFILYLSLWSGVSGGGIVEREVVVQL